MKIISWNIAHRSAVWSDVWALDADIALLQEAPAPDTGDRSAIIPGADTAWLTTGSAGRSWRTAIVNLTGRATLREHSLLPVEEDSVHGVTVHRPGALTIADVMNDGRPVLTIASMYAVWERPPGNDENYMWADASAHRLLSDLSQLVTGRRRDIPIIAAGDLNILYGYGEEGSEYWAGRYRTVFDRAASMGLRFVGPQAPNGRQAEPWPDELPRNSRNVPTYRSTRQTATTATRQLDFVFASERIADRIGVRALNQPDEWGPSDHCRVEMDVADSVLTSD